MNNTTQHAPGPWSLGFNTSKESAQVITSEGWHLASVEFDPVEANARLISAAPELLTALQGLATYTYKEFCFCDGWHTTSGHPKKHTLECDAARAAIAKATGEDVA